MRKGYRKRGTQWERVCVDNNYGESSWVYTPLGSSRLMDWEKVVLFPGDDHTIDWIYVGMGEQKVWTDLEERQWRARQIRFRVIGPRCKVCKCTSFFYVCGQDCVPTHSSCFCSHVKRCVKDCPTCYKECNLCRSMRLPS